jgi:hypothetical protein
MTKSYYTPPTVAVKINGTPIFPRTVWWFGTGPLDIKYYTFSTRTAVVYFSLASKKWPKYKVLIDTARHSSQKLIDD